MSSVLLSLRLGMFVVAKALTPLLHECIKGSNFDILSGGADMCSCKSSTCVVVSHTNNNNNGYF